MKSVIETATGRAFYLFADAEVVTITAQGMTRPVRASDIKTSTHSIVDTPPPEVWVGGGVLAWVADNWVVTDQMTYDAEVVRITEEARANMPTLTRRQLRLALLSVGITAADVEGHIDAIVDPTERAAAFIEWEDASSYERNHLLVGEIATEMELPPEQVDALWMWAAGI